MRSKDGRGTVHRGTAAALDRGTAPAFAGDASLRCILAEHGTPTVILDLAVIRGQIAAFRGACPDARCFFSTSVNSEPAVVDTVLLEGLDFGAGSVGEIDYLLGRGVAPERILFTNQVQSDAEIRHAADRGVHLFAVDSLHALEERDIVAPSGVLALDRDDAGDYVFIHDIGADIATLPRDYHLVAKPPIVCVDSEDDHQVQVGPTAHTGFGVMARRPFQPGERILSVSGSFTPRRTRYTLQIDATRHLEPTLLARHLNHSCQPNAGVITNRRGLLDVVAMTAITTGEEVTVDYAMFEYELGPMAAEPCRCETPGCRRSIGGYRALDCARRTAYTGFVADYLVAPR